MSKPTRNKTSRKRKTEVWTVRFFLVKVHPSLICRIKGELGTDAVNAHHAFSKAITHLKEEFPKWNEGEFLLRRSNDVTGKWIKLTNKGGLSHAETSKTTKVDSKRKQYRRGRTRNDLQRVDSSDGDPTN